MTVAELQVVIEANATHFEAAIKKVASDLDRLQRGGSRSVDNLSRAWGDAGRKMALAGGAMTLGLTLPLLGAAKAAVAASSNLEESITKSIAVFKSAGASVAAWAKKTDASFGVSRQAALDYSAAFGLMFKSTGATVTQAATLGKSMTELSADLASFFNSDIDTAMQKLRAGLAGEAEPLRQWGVFLSENAVKAQALAMGFSMVNGQLSEQAKMQARMAIIYKQTSDAQGDFARTSEGLANQQRILKAEFENEKSELGVTLLPIMKDAVKVIRGLMTEFRGLSLELKNTIVTVSGFLAVAGPVVAVLGFMATSISSIIALWGTATTAITAAGGGMAILGSAITALSGPVGWVIAAAAIIAVAWQNNWGGIREFVTGTVSQIVEFWKANLPLIQQATSTLAEQVKARFGWIGNAWNAIVSSMLSVWETFKGAFNAGLTSVLGLTRAVLQAMSGNWKGAASTIQATALSAWASIQAGLARAGGQMLRSIQSLAQGAANAFSGMVGMKAPKVLGGIDAITAGLDKQASMWDKVVNAQRRSVTGQPKGFIGPMRISGITPTDPKVSTPSFSGITGSIGGGGRSSGRGGGSGGGGLSKAENPVATQAKELRDSMAAATRAIALNGDATESAALKYRIASKEIKGEHLALAESLVSLLRRKESLEKLAQVTANWISTMAGLRKELLMNRAVTNEDRVSIEMFGKEFSRLTDEKNKAMVKERAALMGTISLESELRSKIVESKKAAAELWVSLSPPKAALSELERVKAALAGVAGAAMSPMQEYLALIVAIARDSGATQARQESGLARMRKGWADLIETAREWRDGQIESSNQRLAEMMDDLARRTQLAATVAQRYKLDLDDLAESLGIGATRAENIASGMARAKAVMNETFRVEQLEKFRDELFTIADTITTQFDKMFDGFFNDGFKGFFRNVLGGFRDMVSQMALEWAKAQVRNAVSGFLTNAIGGIVGGMSGGGGGNLTGDISYMTRSVGGPLYKGLTLVGERGPELVMSGGGGSVVSAEKTKSMIGNSVVVNITVHSPNADSFRESEGQIAQRMAQRLRKMEFRGA